MIGLLLMEALTSSRDLSVHTHSLDGSNDIKRIKCCTLRREEQNILKMF